ncbi:MAG: polyphosphate glucokinase [Acidimicrobiales bacterium]|nr:polyphosphate glucokinase [Acidimicrobiales bacterium]
MAIDIGGTGLKATVLDPAGREEHERVRIPTTFPCPPDKLVADLAGLVEPLPPYDRVSVGFPGVVRRGRIRTAPAFVTVAGLGSKVDHDLVAAWADVDLAGALAKRLGKPVQVANDADVQGAGAVKGEGIELVITLGTGVGSAVFDDGKLALHLELAHHPIKTDETYNDYLGDAARKKVGAKRWNKRVAKAIGLLDLLITPDAILIGGGNAQKITADLGPKVSLVDNDDGLLGGIKLWDGAGME